mgnify:CR=1 FL=1
MPYRRALRRFSKSSWEDFGDEVHRAQNEHLMEGIVAGCALVAYADGWVTDDEHDRMVIIRPPTSRRISTYARPQPGHRSCIMLTPVLTLRDRLPHPSESRAQE